MEEAFLYYKQLLESLSPLFLFPRLFLHKVSVDGKIAFMSFLCDLTAFDGGNDRAILGGFLGVGAVGITAICHIRLKFGEAMGQILKRIEIKFNEIEHRKAGRVRHKSVCFHIDQLSHRI